MNKKKKMKRLRTGAGEMGGAILRLLYPPRCPLCDRIRPWKKTPEMVCEDCRNRLPWVTGPACMKCGKPVESPEKEFCDDCARTRHFYDCGRAAFTYTGAMRGSVYRMKAQNRRDYLDFYAAAMLKAGGWYLRLWKPEKIVPIPMHWRKRAVRGYDQAELLAVKLSRLTGIPCDRKLLRCVRYTENQKELDRQKRLKNLTGSFEVTRANNAHSVLPSRVLLVDDVYTTGSTLDEAARVLSMAGVEQIFFLVLCTGKGKKRLHDTKSVLY